MARKKKSRKISDIMPIRKSDSQPKDKAPRKSGRGLTRYELDLKAKELKRKKKHKGLASGARHSGQEEKQNITDKAKDPRVGSRRKVSLIVEEVLPKSAPQHHNNPKDVIEEVVAKKSSKLSPMVELERLESNEILNDLLDKIEDGKAISAEDQTFVDECLTRIEELMKELGLNEEEESEESLYTTFNTIDINQFK